MSFKKRSLRVRFTLSQGAFNDANDDTVEIDDLSIRAKIEDFSFGEKSAEIYVTGLSVHIINRLITLKAVPKSNAWQPNRVTLLINDENDKETVVFFGYIYHAFGNFNLAPDIPLHIFATSSYYAQMTVPEGINFPGSAKVSDIIETLAFKGGWGLVNHNVTKAIRDTSLNGDLWGMLSLVARAAKIDFFIESGKLHIINMEGPRDDIPAMKMSRNTGLVGYPMPTVNGCSLQCEFDIKYRMRSKIEVDVPEIQVINGIMYVNAIVHQLDTGVPKGNWLTNLRLVWVAEDVNQNLGA
ncbi:hypothetical protein NB640_06290 [Oxalobacter vibrioformis]|uniref:Uncharacterized protein n=1 Tax=Oxalobacter vibrioformis TaxID=933080 RepID=A0A9E9P3Q5_9BURK|nr:hypothetical protein [Oxalobacter vibrioformis]WAW11234.1 hypothetical protein NB640_06290 [Oxalobacter vibrioformis]